MKLLRPRGGEMETVRNRCRQFLTKVKLNRPSAININSDTLSSQSVGSPVRIDWADVAYAVEYSGGHDADD